MPLIKVTTLTYRTEDGERNNYFARVMHGRADEYFCDLSLDGALGPALRSWLQSTSPVDRPPQIPRDRELGACARRGKVDGVTLELDDRSAAEALRLARIELDAADPEI